jgi:hypothetical protein
MGKGWHCSADEEVSFRSKVSQTLADGDGGNDKYLLSIQMANDLAMRASDNIGYNDGLLQVKTKHNKEDAIPLTVPHLKERVELLRNAAPHSSKFLATRGNHLTNNNHFIVAQMNVSGKNINELLSQEAADEGNGTRCGSMRCHGKVGR